MSQPISNASFDLQPIVSALSVARQNWRIAHHRSIEPGGRDFPSREEIARILKGLRGALFPMRLGPPDLRQESEDFYVGHTLDSVLHALLRQVRLELSDVHRNDKALTSGASLDARAIQIVRDFALALPSIRVLLDSDVTAAYEGDPAAHSVDEVLLCYPGIEAVICHRLAHELHRLGVPLLARFVAEIAHGNTGIDIHPGATIGPGFFIDHGTGVVIGETAVIGARVRIYQAVTLGAKSFPLDACGRPIKGLARHPIVEDDVVIYAGATVLGRVTIGRGASIGGNVWVTHDVSPQAHVTQAHSLREDLTEGGWL
jgi:serine O-acetyltransferase